MNIYIKMETKVRELHSRFLLGLVAAERGHSVLIGPAALTSHLAAAGVLKPGIVHENSIAPGKKRLEQLRAYKRYGFICTSQDEESGLLEENYSKFARLRFSEESISLVKKIFAWGRQDQEGLITTFPEINDLSKKIALTGSPRVDLWRPDFFGMYKINKKGPRGRKFVLVVSNFTQVAGINQVWKQILWSRESGYSDRGYSWQDTLSQAGFIYELTRRFIEGIIAVAEKFPDVDFVFRPHPIESEEAWEAIIGGKRNIFISKAGSVSEWVRHSEAVIHNGCTTGLEAVVSRVPVVAFRPICSPNESFFPNRVSHETFDEAGLIETISNIIRDREKQVESKSGCDDKAIVFGLFHNFEGRLAVDQIVDEWDCLDDGSFSQPNMPAVLMAHGNAYHVRRFARKIRTRFQGKKSSSQWTANFKFDALRNGELYELHQRFKDVTKRFEKIRIRQYGRFLFGLQSS
jgi:surface carbohydrate biosynthesis protein